MRRIADLYPGEGKTDARDAAIIADAARPMPYTLPSIELPGETVAELHMIVGFDDDRPRAPCGGYTRGRRGSGLPVGEVMHVRAPRR